MTPDLPRPPAWTEHALCGDADPELFFADDRFPWMQREAAAICADCPVRLPCKTDALQRKERHGIWGGEDLGKPARERHNLTTRRNKRERQERKAS